MTSLSWTQVFLLCIGSLPGSVICFANMITLLRRNMIHRFASLSTDDSLLTQLSIMCSISTDSIYREQSAEMKHDKQVCESIYREQSAEYNVIHWFLAISTEGSLRRINMINRFTTISTEGSLPRLNMIHVLLLSQFVTLSTERSLPRWNMIHGFATLLTEGSQLVWNMTHQFAIIYRGQSAEMYRDRPVWDQSAEMYIEGFETLCT